MSYFSFSDCEWNKSSRANTASRELRASASFPASVFQVQKLQYNLHGYIICYLSGVVKFGKASGKASVAECVSIINSV
jgi:hypothetical protein